MESSVHNEARRRVQAEARSWLGTPYHPRAGVKGVGCDCAYLLLKVYETVGLAPPIDPGPYRSGMAMLRSGERMYLGLVEQFAVRRDPPRPQPGDVVLFRFVRLTHGGIVDEWPYFIHAFHPYSQVVRSSVQDPYFVKRTEGVWVPKALL